MRPWGASPFESGRGYAVHTNTNIKQGSTTMSILSSLGLSKSPSLGAQLSVKATELRTKQEREAQASRDFAELSRQAADTSTVAAKHAAAVEEATAILQDAGVTL